MSRWARNRDIVERDIVSALQAVGASVTRLDATGAPDLLVGFRGETWLLECKDRHEAPGRGMKKTDDGLRDSQREWWAKWKGKPPEVVTTKTEALEAIGAKARAA